MVKAAIFESIKLYYDRSSSVTLVDVRLPFTFLLRQFYSPQKNILTNFYLIFVHQEDGEREMQPKKGLLMAFLLDNFVLLFLNML